MLGSIIISDVVSLRTRGLLNGVGSVCWAVGSGFGGVYGGLVADTYVHRSPSDRHNANVRCRLGWRWAFLREFINLQAPENVNLIAF